MAQEKESPLLEALKKAVIDFDTENIEALCHEYLDLGLDANKAVFEGLIPGMLEVGRLYEEQVYFIPEMLMCAETLYKGLEIFQPHMTSSVQNACGKILIGVVEGDVHDIGKNLVKLMFEISGYEVTDLGRDVPVEVFLKTALKNDFDLVCMSSMMSTTMYEMKGLIQKLKEKKPDLKVMIGGSPVTKLHAIKWRADGYAPDAHKALSVVQQMLNTAKLIDEQRKQKT
ncbi:methyltransferase cognate corrinoid protein [Thermincola ferriacetica]|uniref:Methyltransferase cognate corrinoid protein n=1 Tax=Thermincola ferriacetica TaxID=281456 RepID=A0A0L6W0T6_9FIRM|nr:corrinoid protein [Thermincola ferriacetica]KNZ69145.1 methyltransferase cognate corrinoid protein [Thermincola ferriacetica]